MCMHWSSVWRSCQFHWVGCWESLQEIHGSSQFPILKEQLAQFHVSLSYTTCSNWHPSGSPHSVSHFFQATHLASHGLARPLIISWRRSRDLLCPEFHHVPLFSRAQAETRQTWSGAVALWPFQGFLSSLTISIPKITSKHVSRHTLKNNVSL